MRMRIDCTNHQFMMPQEEQRSAQSIFDVDYDGCYLFFLACTDRG